MPTECVLTVKYQPVLTSAWVASVCQPLETACTHEDENNPRSEFKCVHGPKRTLRFLQWEETFLELINVHGLRRTLTPTRRFFCERETKQRLGDSDRLPPLSSTCLHTSSCSSEVVSCVSGTVCQHLKTH